MLMPVEGFEIVAMDGIELFNFRAANRAIVFPGGEQGFDRIF
jgi:hypothetical protein